MFYTYVAHVVYNTIQLNWFGFELSHLNVQIIHWILIQYNISIDSFPIPICHRILHSITSIRTFQMIKQSLPTKTRIIYWIVRNFRLCITRKNRRKEIHSNWKSIKILHQQSRRFCVQIAHAVQWWCVIGLQEEVYRWFPLHNLSQCWFDSNWPCQRFRSFELSDYSYIYICMFQMRCVSGVC